MAGTVCREEEGLSERATLESGEGLPLGPVEIPWVPQAGDGHRKKFLFCFSPSGQSSPLAGAIDYYHFSLPVIP